MLQNDSIESPDKRSGSNLNDRLGSVIDDFEFED